MAHRASSDMRAGAWMWGQTSPSIRVVGTTVCSAVSHRSSRTPKGGQARIGGKHNGRGANDGRVHVLHAEASVAMGIDWMTRDELSESIPPAYTEWIGRQLIASLVMAA